MAANDVCGGKDPRRRENGSRVDRAQGLQAAQTGKGATKEVTPKPGGNSREQSGRRDCANSRATLTTMHPC